MRLEPVKFPNVTGHSTQCVKMVEKLLKYKEISKRWGVKTETVPVVIRALGLVKYVKKIPGSINIEGLQKISLLDKAHFFNEMCSAPTKKRLPLAAPKEDGSFSELCAVRTAKQD